MVKKNNFTLLITLSVLSIVLVSCGEPYGAPVNVVQKADLLGTWIAHYGTGTTDTILLKDTTTFQQRFTDTNQNYIYESNWNKWELEYLSNGLYRVYLYGARYYLAGIEVAETDGRRDPKNPCLTPTDCSWGVEPRQFYDPYTQGLVQMVGELILDVRVDASGNLILHHMWTSSDRGFALIGGDQEIFYRTELLSPQGN